MTNIEIKPGEYADVMPDMSDGEYAALKQSIEQDGLRHPIEVTDEGVIVDGHHRYRACQELDVEPEFTVVEDPTVEQAIRSNFTRRNLDDGTKKAIVTEYLDNHYDGERTQEEIANDLGVSQPTVSRAWKDSPNTFSTTEKRQEVADYIREHPYDSDRAVANATGVSHPTVAAVREDVEHVDADAPSVTDPDPTPDDTETEPDGDPGDTPEHASQQPDEEPDADGGPETHEERSEPRDDERAGSDQDETAANAIARQHELEMELEACKEKLREARTATATASVDVDAVKDAKIFLDRALEDLPEDVPARSTVEDAAVTLQEALDDD